MRTAIELYVIDKVKDLRHRENMSQIELSNRMGVATGFVGKVESSTSLSKYNLNHINKISEIFDISPRELLPEKHL
ncbi:MAG: helix-turn-helix domain-containing protein [Bacteroidales bacterium]|jgi:transcriptional regulator with XRE-family HTH domain|nr:helix-turn-helix domain-containing protein [Bacteroidales bacterium]